MSPTQGLLEQETQKKYIGEEGAAFMIQPLSIKGNDCWTLVSIIHNQTEARRLILHENNSFHLDWQTVIIL